MGFVYIGFPMSLIKQKNFKGKKQFLVQWIGDSSRQATWEFEDKMQTTYPSYFLEDKQIIEEGTMSQSDS